MSSPAHGAAVQLLHEAEESPDALVHPPVGWRKTSIIEEIQEAYNIVHDIHEIKIEDIFVNSPFKLQTIITKKLVDCEGTSA